MYKIGLLSIMICFVISNVSAQQNRAALKEKIESRKVAYLSDKLSLSPEEAQQFWPVYNKYSEEQQEIRQNMDLRKERTDFENADHKALLDKMITAEESALDVKKKYAEQISSIIGAKKTLMFFRAEQKFKEDMLRELKSRRGQRGDRPGR